MGTSKQTDLVLLHSQLFNFEFSGIFQGELHNRPLGGDTKNAVKSLAKNTSIKTHFKIRIKIKTFLQYFVFGFLYKIPFLIYFF